MSNASMAMFKDENAVLVLAEQNQDRFIYIYICIDAHTHTKTHKFHFVTLFLPFRVFFELAMSHSTRTLTPTDSACLSLHPSHSVGAP
jgi:hypothetical protein